VKPWGYAPSRIGGQDGLYCVTPDCGARILEDGKRQFDHVEGCETQLYEDALSVVLAWPTLHGAEA
jgi:hypothetical protein